VATGLGWGDTDEENTNRVWGFDAVGVQYAGWAFDADIRKVRSAAGTPLHVYLKLRPARLHRRQLSLPSLSVERSRGSAVDGRASLLAGPAIRCSRWLARLGAPGQTADGKTRLRWRGAKRPRQRHTDQRRRRRRPMHRLVSYSSEGMNSPDSTELNAPQLICLGHTPPARALSHPGDAVKTSELPFLSIVRVQPPNSNRSFPGDTSLSPPSTKHVW
jgi:hypothetical protein